MADRRARSCISYKPRAPLKVEVAASEGVSKELKIIQWPLFLDFLLFNIRKVK